MKRIFLLLLPLLLWTACEDEPSKPEPQAPGILFHTTFYNLSSSETFPAAGVELFQRFLRGDEELMHGEAPDNSNMLVAPHPVRERLCVKVILPATGVYTLKITNILMDIVYHESDVNANNNNLEFIFPTSDSSGVIWPTGKYKLEIIGSDTTLAEEFFIRMDTEQPTYYVPNYTTNDDGDAFIPYANLLIGEKVHIIDEVGHYLGYKIIGAEQSIYCMRNGWGVHRDFEAVTDGYTVVHVDITPPID